MTRSTSQAGLDRLHQALAARVAKGELPGMVTLVAHGDDVDVDAIGAFAFGSSQPMRRDTIFRIASLAKPILATATMMLADDGKLALEEPVDRLLPELANRKVLKHIDGPLDDTVPANRPVTVEDLLTFRMGHGMLFEPSFDPPFPIVNVANELQPLGMRESGFSMPAERTSRLPSYYMTNFQTGTMELQTLSAPSEWTSPPVFPTGASGLLSTVDDYLAFACLLLNKGVHRGERLVSEKSVELMTTNHLTPDQIAGGGPLLDGQGWGFGMAVSTAPDEVSPVPGRYGWAGGYGTCWFNDPDRKLIAILMTQTSNVMWNGTLNEFSMLAANP